MIGELYRIRGGTLKKAPAWDFLKIISVGFLLFVAGVLFRTVQMAIQASDSVRFGL